MSELRRIFFVDDEPFLVDMMMNMLSVDIGQPVAYATYSDPDLLADLIEEKKLGSDDLIVIDRFLHQRDCLTLQLPRLFKSLGFNGKIVIFSYIAIDAAAFGYDGYIKKDIETVSAFRAWMRLDDADLAGTAKQEVL